MTCDDLPVTHGSDTDSTLGTRNHVGGPWMHYNDTCKMRHVAHVRKDQVCLFEQTAAHTLGCVGDSMVTKPVLSTGCSGSACVVNAWLCSLAL